MYITYQLKQNQRDQKGLGEDQLPDLRGMGEEQLRPRSTLCAVLAAAPVLRAPRPRPLRAGRAGAAPSVALADTRFPPLRLLGPHAARRAVPR